MCIISRCSQGTRENFGKLGKTWEIFGIIYWPNLFTSVACTINIYDRRFYYRNDIGLCYNTLETIVIDNPSLS